MFAALIMQSCLQSEDVSKSLGVMKATMFAAGESEPAKEAAVVTAYEVYTSAYLCRPDPAAAAQQMSNRTHYPTLALASMLCKQTSCTACRRSS